MARSVSGHHRQATSKVMMAQPALGSGFGFCPFDGIAIVRGCSDRLLFHGLPFCPVSGSRPKRPDQSFSAPSEGITCWAARYMQMKMSVQQLTLAGSIGAGCPDWHGSNCMSTESAERHRRPG
jgi:hypothetical protein